MNVGDMVKFYDSTRKNGPYAGKLGLIIEFDPYDNPVIKVEGVVKDFHYTQVEVIYDESR